MDTRSTYGLKIEQLADLFSIGLERTIQMDGILDDEATAHLLREQLTRPLPKDSFLLDSVLLIMGRLGCDVRSLAGKSLGQVLLDPGSDIGLLQAIKDHSKKLSHSSVCQAEAAVATTIYYAALASSLLYQGKKITQYSHEDLDQSFAVLMEKKWMAPELAGLFRRARSGYKDKKSDK